ncbi:hypothetical protein Bca4012_026782 [Brassica carinata]
MVLHGFSLSPDETDLSFEIIEVCRVRVLSWQSSRQDDRVFYFPQGHIEQKGLLFFPELPLMRIEGPVGKSISLKNNGGLAVESTVDSSSRELRPTNKTKNKRKKKPQQTYLPTIPVVKLIPSGEFPECEIQQHKDEVAAHWTRLIGGEASCLCVGGEASEGGSGGEACGLGDSLSPCSSYVPWEDMRRFDAKIPKHEFDNFRVCEFHRNHKEIHQNQPKKLHLLMLL